MNVSIETVIAMILVIGSFFAGWLAIWRAIDKMRMEMHDIYATKKYVREKLKVSDEKQKEILKGLTDAFNRHEEHKVRIRRIEKHVWPTAPPFEQT